MLAGISLFSLLTASLSTLLMERKEASLEAKVDRLLAHLEEIERKADQN